MLLSAIHNPPPEIAGSAAWQTVFVSFAVLLILFEVIRGWRLGILRQLMRVAAVVAAYAAAFFCGNLTVPIMRRLVTMPDIILSALGNAILAMLVYAVVGGLGTIFFKRTAQQSSGATRLAYGASGAVVGFLFGAFFIWLMLVGIRSVGSIAEAQVQARTTNGANRNSSVPSTQPQSPDEVLPKPDVDVDSLMTLLARLKNSVEIGAVGEVVKKTDAMPPGVYQTLSDVGTVVANPETARRFLSYSGAKELSEHPKIVALRQDPEIATMIAQGRLMDLLRDPRIIAAANDPGLADRVKQFDLKKALEYAQQKE
ncbi:MAG: CvpA family protein [Verrucomicrobiota bacterium]|nr:CvpA family protein [Verrucomicrobiota bacterium]